MSPSPSPLFRLPQLGLIRAGGADAQAFLQGQLSNDVRQLTPDRAQLSGYCSPKGRLLAVVTVLLLADGAFALVLPRSLVAPTLKRLKMFVLRSQVTLDEVPEFQLAGRFDGVEGSAWQLGAADRMFSVSRPGLPRALVLAPADQTIPEDADQASAWQLAELEAGLPAVHPQTLDRFVPQTADLDLAGGISFTKGCYPGQEIVARVHYLGRAKQRLFLAGCASAAEPGAPVHAAGGEQPVGEVMECLPAGADGHRLSLVLNLSAADAALRLGDAQGPSLSELRPAHPVAG